MGCFGNGYVNYDPYNDSDFSPEFIQQLRESILDINEVLESVDLTIVTESGEAVKNKAEIKKNMDKASKDIADEIKKNGLKNRKTISGIMDNFWNKCTFVLDESTYESILEKNKSFTGAKVNKAFKLTICCYVVNSLLHNILMLILGKAISEQITVSIVAPIVEENAKQIAVKDGIEKEFAVVFNAVEYSLYVVRYASVGLGKIATLRVFPVLMHLSTIVIQKITNNTKLHKELGIEDLEKAEKKKRIAFIGHLVSVLIHAAWNSGGAALVIPEKLLT